MRILRGKVFPSRRALAGLWIWSRFVRPVDFHPFGAHVLSVRHLPLWTPGATFLRQAAVWKKQVDTMFDGPFDLFTQKMVSNVDSGVRVMLTGIFRSPATTRLTA